MPIQHILICQENRLPLAEGVTILGRALGCGIRFNTATVSRQHLKLFVAGDRLTAENLSTTTGTLVNGIRLQGLVRLRPGDRLQVGAHLVWIEADLITEDLPVPASRVTGSDFGTEGDTRSGQDPTRIPLHVLAASARHVPGVGVIESHTCPRCRVRVAFTENVCAICGYSWGPSHPSSVTERIMLSNLVDAGDHAPVTDLAVPVIYSSAEMTIDGTVRDISQSGMFLPSELLDTPATPCEVTILPDGHAVLALRGVVRTVRQRADASGPAGLNIEFVEVPLDAVAWLAARNSLGSRAKTATD